MTQPFLITGFPRCRTAWLSAVANTVPSAICRHEPTTELPWRDALDFLADPEFAHAGISDAALGFHLGEIIGAVGARVLIVDRPPAEVEASLASIGLYGDIEKFCRVLADAMDPYREHPLVKCVRFDDLGDDETVRASLAHLMPGAILRRSKIAEMQHMMVQTDMRRIRRLVAARGPVGAVETLGSDVMAALA